MERIRTMTIDNSNSDKRRKEWGQNLLARIIDEIDKRTGSHMSFTECQLRVLLKILKEDHPEDYKTWAQQMIDWELERWEWEYTRQEEEKKLMKAIEKE